MFKGSDKLIKLSNENFDELIKGRTVLVDFYADWCGPCRMLAPVLEEASTKFDIEIIKVNVDEHEGIAKKYGVMSIPTLIVFENGTEKKRNVGYIDIEGLKDFIN